MSSELLPQPFLMARVSISLFASVRDVAGASHLEMEVEDMHGLLRGLAERFGEGMQALIGSEGGAGDLVVLLNGMNLDLSAWAHPLTDGDEVSLFPPISGG